ncbi:MAG: integrase arm-type DNA-binding domain-containing protein [Pseudomonadota bacterium]
MPNLLSAVRLEQLRRNPPTRNVTIPDGSVGGLELRASASGVLSWSLRYRVHGFGGLSARGIPKAGPQRRMNLGRYPAVSLREARAMAQQHLIAAESGVDPLEGERQSALDRVGSALTVSQLVDRFVAEYGEANLGAKTVAQIKWQLKAHVVPEFGARPIAAVTRLDASRLLANISKKDPTTGRGGPHAANDCRKWMRRMFNWARDQGIVENNPFDGLRQPAKVQSRDRVLSIQELRAVWDGAGTLGYPWGDIYRLLILTGARRSEWTDAQWRWIDLAEERIEWPAASYKSRRTHVVPLVGYSKQILEQMPRWQDGEYLFSTTQGEKPVSSFSKARTKLDEAIDQDRMSGDHWVVHDIRRSVATHMAGFGVDEIVIERLLGHAIPGVRGIYNRYRYLNEVKDALLLWETELLK